MALSPDTFDLLRLTMVPELGPIRIGRLLARFGSAGSVFGASIKELETVEGIGAKVARSVVASGAESERAAKEESERSEATGVTILYKGGPGYPPLLGQLDDAPPILYMKGSIEPGDAWPVAIVGSRRCTTYGMEQAERFASILAQAGLTIVSGGARGIDTAAHRGACRAAGRTIAVLGCGLEHAYPPENAELFDTIAGGRGAVISELPLRTAPDAKNFPARNRIISGLSLGVVLIEAAAGSGALITARQAAEDHGREVMAVPGRVDSPASEGSNGLLKAGGALLVTEPGDVIALLESPARHAFSGTHAARYGGGRGMGDERGLFERTTAEGEAGSTAGLDEVTSRVLNALVEPKTLDDLAAATGLEAGTLRSRLTLLEIEKRVVREGARFYRSRRI